MFNKGLTILLRGLKVVVFLSTLLCLPEFANAQSCDCIDPPSCNPCEGGINRIVFEFSGDFGTLGSYSVRDAGGVVQTGFLSSNNITINNSPFNEAFEGGFIAIQFFNFLLSPVGDEYVILTNCTEFKIGRVYANGMLKVLEATSPVSGPLCCEPESTDQIPPEFVNFPQDIELSLESGCSMQYSWEQPSVIDDCGISGFVPPVPTNSQVFQLGARSISYTAIDQSGNTFTDSFTVTVVDQIPPEISNMPANINRIANGNCQAPVSWTAPSASDNCEVVEFLSSRSSGSIFELGTTEVTYTARDNSDNISTRSFNVTVSDTTKPVFLSFPDNLTVAANENCEAKVNWEVPIVTDNCSESITPVGSSAPGDLFLLGNTIVNYSATDDSGNESQQSFTITVVDDTAPVFSSFPEDIRVSVGDACEVPVTWNTPVAIDNCSAPNVELLAGSPESGDLFTLGTRTVTYKAADAAGNEVLQSFEITVIDGTAPTFSACPQDIFLSAESSCEVRADWVAPQATDNCELLEVSANAEPGTNFPIGTTQVSYTAIDASGNEAICTFNVVVSNDFEPVVENCPPNVQLELFDAAGVRHNWEEPTISLECASVVPQSNFSPGDLFREGRTEVRYFYDSNGEEEVFCSFIVDVAVAEIEFEPTQLLTPNGDGVNDTWLIRRLDNFRNNSVTVVDRWGGEVYSAKAYDNDRIVWDGSNKSGELVPTGTYYYFITVEFESSVVKKNGFIELIR